jgi:elongation factor P--beta-lysine ligase
MEDTLVLRMALASNLGAKTISNSMPMETRFPPLLRARIPWCKKEGYILYLENYPEHKIRRIHAKRSHPIAHHAYIYRNEASISRHTTHIKIPKKKIVNASNEPSI